MMISNSQLPWRIRMSAQYSLFLCNNVCVFLVFRRDDLLILNRAPDKSVY